jgi:hypothetical protein
MTEPQKPVDRLSAVTKAPKQPNSLVGSFFHSTHTPGWQGCVVAEVAPAVYLVELFSWFAGDSTDQQLVKLDDMGGWTFYDDAEWMNNAYEHTIAERWKRQRREAKGEDPDGSPEEIAAELATLAASLKGDAIGLDQEMLEDDLRLAREVLGDLRDGDPRRMPVERYIAHLEAYQPDVTA